MATSALITCATFIKGGGSAAAAGVAGRQGIGAAQTAAPA